MSDDTHRLHQEAFNKVCDHLMTQQSKSYANWQHLLRHEGRACALGCLIPEGVYESSMEDLNLSDLIDRVNEIRDLDREFLRHLMRVHDYHQVLEWTRELRGLAERWSLSVPDCVPDAS